MYALVYFPGDKSSSVVYEKFIRWPQHNQSDRGNMEKRPNVNDIVEVLWDDKVIEGKILHRSTNRNYLEKLVVSENGELKEPTKKQIREQASSNLSKKIKLDAEKKIGKEARDKTQKLFNNFLLSSGSEDINSGSIQNESVIESPHEINGTLNTDLFNEEPNCAFCSSIPVTAESITALEMILSHMKQRFEKMSKAQETNRTSNSLCPANVKEKPMHWEIPGLGKMRLMENIDVWVDGGNLTIITESTKANANEMLRKLLIFLIGEEALANSSALGHGGKPAINPKVYTAVKGYVMKHVTGIDNSFPFNRVVNQLCASRAAKLGVRKYEKKQLIKSKKCSEKSLEIVHKTTTKPNEFLHQPARVEQYDHQPSTSHCPINSLHPYASSIAMHIEPRYEFQQSEPPQHPFESMNHRHEFVDNYYNNCSLGETEKNMEANEASYCSL